MTAATPASPTRFALCLFVTGASPRSMRAIRAVRDICDERLAGRYDLEVVDIYQHPQRASADQVVGAPTLVKTLPLPVRRIIGDMSNRPRLAAGLGLSAQ